MTLAETEHVARKPHGCNVCLGIIGAGDTYSRQRNVDHGDAWTHKAHRLCRAAWYIAHRELQLEWDEEPDRGEILAVLRRFFEAVMA